jgi:hypothetical protein
MHETYLIATLLSTMQSGLLYFNLLLTKINLSNSEGKTSLLNEKLDKN